MSDAFISYSRRDTDYVRALASSLTEAGKDVWVDTEGIRDAERFPEALSRAIEGSDSFLFVISPDSVSSEYCEQEIQMAAELNKRIVPLALRQVPDEDIPDEVRYRNWIPVTPEQPGTDRVVAAMETDLAWDQQHTQITTRTLQWDRADRDRSMLLRGAELTSAEQWMAVGASKDPGPTEIQQQYILAGRGAASRRQRMLMSGIGAVAVIAVGLLIFALISRSAAVSAKATAVAAKTSAQSQALAADSVNEETVDPELAVLLGIRAVQTNPSAQAMFSLRDAIDSSTIRARVTPSAGAQICGGPGVSWDPVASAHLVAVGLCGGRIEFANSRTGTVERAVTLPKAAGTTTVTYVSDGSALLATDGGRPELLNPTTGAVRERGPKFPDQGGVFTPARAAVVVGTGLGYLYVWNLKTNRVTRIAAPPQNSLGNLAAVAVSPDGRQVALGFTGTYNYHEIGFLVANIASRKIVYERRSYDVSALAYSPDGRSLAIGTNTVNADDAISLISAKTFRTNREFTPINEEQVAVSQLRFSPGGSRLAYGFADGSAGLVNARTGTQIARFLGDSAAVASLAFSPNGSEIATGSADGSVRFWRGSPLQEQLPAPGVVNVLPTSGGFVELMNASSTAAGAVAVARFSDSGRPLGKPLVISPTLSINAEFISQGGTLAGIVPATPNPKTTHTEVTIWSIPQRRVIERIPMLVPESEEPVISPDGRWLMSEVSHLASPDTELELLNLRSGHERKLATTTCGGGFMFSFNSASRQVAAGTFCQGNVAVYGTDNGRQIGATLTLGGEMSSVAFAPNGRQLAISSWDSQVKVTRLPILPHGAGAVTLAQNAKGVTDVDYSPDGRYLLTTGLDGTARVFDTQDLTERRIITAPVPISSATFTGDGHSILTPTSEGDRMFRWDACTDCENPPALIKLGRSRVTRQMTAAEKREFGLS